MRSSAVTAAIPRTRPADAWCLEGSGSAAALARATDWSQTALGPVAAWPASLKAIVATALNSRQPMLVWWGPELVQLYNDAFIASFDRGTGWTAMGQPAAECWSEIWSAIESQLEAVMQRGQPSWNVDQRVPVRRRGRTENAYWTYGYSPLFDDEGRIAGALVSCTDTTARVRAERWQRLVQQLGERTDTAQSTEAIVAHLFQLADDDRLDIPFLLLYGAREAGHDLTLQYYSGIDNQALKRLEAVLKPSLDRAGPHDEEPTPEVAVKCQAQRIALADLGVPHDVAGAAEALVVSRAHADHHDRLVFGLNPNIPPESGYAQTLLQLASIVYAAHDRVAATRMQHVVTLERDNVLLQAPIPTAVLVGPRHTFSLANRKFLELAGRELIGRDYRDVFPEHAADDVPQILDRVYESGIPYSTDEMWLPLVRGGSVSRVCVQFNVEPMRSLEGEVYGLMAVAVDISEQVRARDALRRANEERERLVAELQAASRTKDEFLAMLGHELRNPLAPIVATLDVMRLRAGGVESREVAVIRRQSEHLVRLVDDLLDVGRIVSGKVELKDERVAIAQVLAEAAHMAAPLIEQRGHTFEMHVERDGLFCRGDAVRLAQCVSNLLTNAARYTPPDGRIVLSALREDDTVVIRVTDNGQGMAAEELPRVFELFMQGERSDGGLGIGLALVRNLMRLHGGSVTAVSAGPGCGSEFTLRLPAAGADAPEPVRQEVFEPSQPGALSAGRQVLIVDDNEDAAESLAELLRLDGHEVRIALDPTGALRMLAEFDPEVVILDIGLPGMNGYELGARMREQHPHLDARFFALTGFGAAIDVEKSRAAGFEAHLVKPVDIAQLARLVAGREEA
jgi:PAS domain S-box-containing protein